MGNNLKLPAPYPEAVYDARVTALESVSSATLSDVSSQSYRVTLLANAFQPTTVDPSVISVISSLDYGIGRMSTDGLDAQISTTLSKYYALNDLQSVVSDRVQAVELSSTAFATLFETTLNPVLTAVETQYNATSTMQQTNLAALYSNDARRTAVSSKLPNLMYVRGVNAAMYPTETLSSRMYSVDLSTTSIKDWATMSQTIVTTNTQLSTRVSGLEFAFNRPQLYVATQSVATTYTYTLDLVGAKSTQTGYVGSVIISNLHNNAVVYSNAYGAVTFPRSGSTRSVGLRVTVVNYNSTTPLSIAATWDSNPPVGLNNPYKMPLFVKATATPLPSPSNTTNQDNRVLIGALSRVTFVLTANALMTTYNGTTEVMDGWVYFVN